MSWKHFLTVGWLLVAGLAGCSGPVVTRPVPWPTMPVAITPAPGDVWWRLEPGFQAVTTLDGTLQPGQTVYILAGITEGLSPPSPTSSARKVVFVLACDAGAETQLSFWLETNLEQVVGCGESLTWTLSYWANRLRLGLALDAAASEPLGYHLTATAHNPY